MSNWTNPPQGQPGRPPQQQPYQWPQGQPPQPPKRHRLRNWTLAIVAGLVGIIVVASVASSGGDNGTAGLTDQPQAPATSAAPTQTETTATATTPMPKATTHKPVAKHWVKLSTLKGSASKDGPTVQTKGGQLRLTYTLKGGGGYGTAGIYVMAEDTKLPVADVMITMATTAKDSTLARADAGSYYLSVMSANFKSYVITLEEYR